jgi:uncharacterized protein YkwD
MWAIRLLAAAIIARASWAEANSLLRANSIDPPQINGNDRTEYQASNIAALAQLEAAGKLSPSVNYSHGDPTDVEQLMLELVNRARMNPTAEAARYGIDLNEGLNPGTIDSSPKAPLAFHLSLIASARLHSQWMLDNDQFSHSGAGGSSPGDRMTDAGYRFVGTWGYGENISVMGTSGTPDAADYVRQMHEGLFTDLDIPGRGHRLNLLATDFREIGVGVLEGEFDFSGHILNSVMVTEDFGYTAATSTAFLLGVVYQDSDHDGFYSPGEGIGEVMVKPSRGSHYAVTSASGGYALPVGALGKTTLQLTFSGGSLSQTVTRTVTLAGANVKVDVETLSLPPPVETPITLRLGRAQAGAAMPLTVWGPVKTPINLQVSSDLKSWSDWQSITLTNRPVTISASFDPGPAQKFYRAVIAPAGQP